MCAAMGAIACAQPALPRPTATPSADTEPLACVDEVGAALTGLVGAAARGQTAARDLAAGRLAAQGAKGRRNFFREPIAGARSLRGRIKNRCRFPAPFWGPRFQFMVRGRLKSGTPFWPSARDPGWSVPECQDWLGVKAREIKRKYSSSHEKQRLATEAGGHS